MPAHVLSQLRKVCGVSCEWVLNGPGMEPLVDLTAEHRDQFTFIRARIGEIAGSLDVALDDEGVRSLTNLVLLENTDDYEAALSKIEACIKAVATGR